MQDVGGIVERLLGFLEMGRDHVTAETLIQVQGFAGVRSGDLQSNLVLRLARPSAHRM